MYKSLRFTIHSGSINQTNLLGMHGPFNLKKEGLELSKLATRQISKTFTELWSHFTPACAFYY